MSDIDKKIKEFSSRIKELKEFQVYQKAAEAYFDDKSAQELLHEYQLALKNVDIYRYGNFPAEEVEAKDKIFQDLLEKVRNNEKINNWISSKNKVQEVLGDIAGAISNDLGIEFAPQKKGGCCGK